MERTIIETADGSKTIYLADLDETYHSSHGALQEARHVFIQHGFHFVEGDELVVFEMGFGTGLNALLTRKEAEETGRAIHYLGIEAYPVEEAIWKEMDYPDLLGENWQGAYQELHTATWGQAVPLSETFTLHKLHEKIEVYEPQPEQVDLIYFDAFGPRAQGDMWTPSVLEKMYRMLRPGGVLVTYCAMGQFKRDLKALGFHVEALPGPPGKREMTRAIK